MKRLLFILVLMFVCQFFYSCSEEKDYSGVYEATVTGVMNGEPWKKDFYFSLLKLSDKKYAFVTGQYDRSYKDMWKDVRNFIYMKSSNEFTGNVSVSHIKEGIEAQLQGQISNKCEVKADVPYLVEVTNTLRYGRYERKIENAQCTAKRIKRF